MTLPSRISEQWTAVVFDCADTLLRMDPSRATIFRDAAAEIGVTVLLRDVERAYDIVDFHGRMRSSELKSHPARQEFYYSINAMLCDVLGIRSHFAALHPKLLAAFPRRKEWRPFPDVVETLRHLLPLVPLYVLANWDTNLGAVLKNAELDTFFRIALASATLGAEKPARECYDAFLARTALDPGRTVYVGNEYIADVVGAREAGLTPVLVDRHDKMPSADCRRVLALTDLAPLLER